MSNNSTSAAWFGATLSTADRYRNERPSADLDPGILNASTGTLQVLRANIVSALNDSRRSNSHGDYQIQLAQIDAELEARARRRDAEFAVTVARTGMGAL
jgi:hypothetical protein